MTQNNKFFVGFLAGIAAGAAATIWLRNTKEGKDFTEKAKTSASQWKENAANLVAQLKDGLEQTFNQATKEA